MTKGRMPGKRKKLNLLSKSKLLKLKPLLDELVSKTETPAFIENDPVQFMHAFTDKNDREISGFFAALMAWGRRDIVIAKTEDLLQRMNYSPAEFAGNFTEHDAGRLDGFKHRTFKAEDIYHLVRILQRILHTHGSFEAFWEACRLKSQQSDRELLAVFYEEFFALLPETPPRSRKHLSTPDKNSSCKRLNMYLRWCIRKSSVDTGVMNFMTPAELRVPLDVHVARQARKLGLLARTQNDWKAVLELNAQLAFLNPEDPAGYDFALFGLGVSKEISVPDEFIVNRAV